MRFGLRDFKSLAICDLRFGALRADPKTTHRSSCKPPRRSVRMLKIIDTKVSLTHYENSLFADIKFFVELTKTERAEESVDLRIPIYSIAQKKRSMYIYIYIYIHVCVPITSFDGPFLGF